MSDFDHLALSGRNLKAFLAVIEEGSVTRAAARLGLTQSAVSHTLDRLRALVGDPLFVRSGRGTAPTAHALAMAAHARDILDRYQALASSQSFRADGARVHLTVVAHDLQRDVLLPPLMQRLERAGVDATLRVLAAAHASTALLRDDRCDLLLTPRPPDGSDFMQKRLFVDRFVCFYDGDARPAPRTMEDYLAAGHVIIVFGENEPMAFDLAMRERGISRDVRVTVADFAGIPPFLRGTARLAALPSLLRDGVMKGFAWAPLPFAYPDLPMYMVWHVRYQNDPRHQWLRAAMESVARDVPQPVADGAREPALSPER